jgi:hypothetical protein
MIGMRSDPKVHACITFDVELWFWKYLVVLYLQRLVATPMSTSTCSSKVQTDGYSCSHFTIHYYRCVWLGEVAIFMDEFLHSPYCRFGSMHDQTY